MAFDTFEISDADGRPIHFYELRWGNTEWFYNSSDRDLDLTISGSTETYLGAPILDEGITVGGDNPGDLRINLADNLPVVDLFRGTPPSENVKVVVIRKHEGDTESTVFFAGKVNNVKRDGKGKATLFCSIGKQRRGGLRLTWSRSCPHVLYDRQCRLNREDFVATATVTAVTGNGFTVDVEPNATLGYYDGGIIAWDADGLGTLEQRAIEKGTSTTEFTMFGRADGLEVGQLVSMYPGCDRLSSTCNGKFDNLSNYGGITQMPGESPYNSNIF